MTDDTIAIITLVYKNYTVLLDFFESLNSQTDTRFHLYIADASPERKQIDTTIPHTVIPIENKGYAHGVNAGIHQAIQDGISQFIIINNDVLFNSDFVAEVRNALQRHPQSLIGGKILYAPGYEYHKERYSHDQRGNVIWYAGGTVDWAHALTHHRGVDEVDTGQFDDESQTGFITGCMCVFDRASYKKIGAWDESYFLYYEDVDYSVRAIKNGIEVWYVPSIVLWHKNGQSTDGSGSSLQEKIQRRARRRFALTYAPLRTKLHVIKNELLSLVRVTRS